MAQTPERAARAQGARLDTRQWKRPRLDALWVRSKHQQERSAPWMDLGPRRARENSNCTREEELGAGTVDRTRALGKTELEQGEGERKNHDQGEAMPRQGSRENRADGRNRDGELARTKSRAHRGGIELEQEHLGEQGRCARPSWRKKIRARGSASHRESKEQRGRSREQCSGQASRLGARLREKRAGRNARHHGDEPWLGRTDRELRAEQCARSRKPARVARGRR
jgi:hypothetical protein